jgi:hypothetical protein
LAAGLAACGGALYVYEGKSYRDKQEALAAVKAGHDDVLAHTRASTNRVGGSLDVYIQDKNVMMERGFRTATPLTQDGKDYMGETAAMSLRNMYDAILKRGSFDQVILHYSGGEHINPQAGQRVVYHYRPGPETSAWYFSSDAVNRQPLHADTGKAATFEKLEFWLDNLDALARKTKP